MTATGGAAAAAAEITAYSEKQTLGKGVTVAPTAQGLHHMNGGSLVLPVNALDLRMP